MERQSSHVPPLPRRATANRSLPPFVAYFVAFAGRSSQETGGSSRFSDRLARIPNLLLQPLVENAIVHGIAPKSGAGRVEVIGRVEDGKLHLEVRDDGPVILDGTKRAREGVGLSSTRERIAKIYGTQGQLSLRSEPGRGVSVRIILRCRT